MEYSLLSNDIRLLKHHKDIMVKEKQIYDVFLPKYFLINAGDDEETINLLMQKNSNVNSDIKELYIMLDRLLNKKATENNIKCFKYIIRLLIKNNATSTLSSIFKDYLQNEIVDNEYILLINKYSRILCDYYLSEKKYHLAIEFYVVFDEKMGKICNCIVSKVHIDEINDRLFDKFVSVYNSIVDYDINNDKDVKLVDLSNNFLNIFNQEKSNLDETSYRWILFFEKVLIDNCSLAVLYNASSKYQTEINFNSSIVYKLLSCSNNRYIRRIRTLTKINKNIREIVINFGYIVDELDIVEKIKNILFVNKIDYPVGYYTSINNFNFMLPNKILNILKKDPEEIGKLALMHYAYMNDPTEGTTLTNVFGIKRDLGDELNYQTVFMKCFTPRIDDIPMWEMYGDKAKGCCVELDWGYILRVEKHLPLYHVCYIDKKFNAFLYDRIDNKLNSSKEINDYIRELKLIKNKISFNLLFMDILNEIKFLFKNIEYGYEGEIRLIYFEYDDCEIKYTNDDIPKLYISSELDACISKLYLGPKCSNVSNIVPYLQKELDEMNKYIYYDNETSILKSNNHYK